MPTGGTWEPAVTVAGITAVGEIVPSHANNAIPQRPTVANALTATAALRNLLGRLCGFCAAKRELDATPSAFMA
jgi:hypothetical protein